MKDLLFSLNGRIPRKTYWIYYLATILALVAASVIDGALSATTPVVTLLVSLALVWPGIAVTVKRWHDRDKSGWWMLITLVPVIGAIWALVENGFLAGTAGDNRFGQSPLAGPVNAE